ncbi:MAG: penicillin-binding protein 2 [Candidatus Omnitrophota bacterium]|nr:MAG: penicillin-binding protein 2 [Candidatus Omnitrophota bacterium]
MCYGGRILYKDEMEKERFFKNLIKVSVGLIVAKCFYLQIIRYPYYSALSKKNCIRTIELDIPRGKIFDRNGRILAEDKPCFNLVFIPYDLENPVKEAKLICKLISVDKKRVLKIMTRKYLNPYDRIIIKKRLSKKEVSVIEENTLNLPGVFVQPGIEREYPLKEKASHLIGYTGEISKEELERLKEKGLKIGDYIGKYGIEKYYDDYLRGIPGGVRVEVDALGHQRKILGEKKMVPGNNLILTIDGRLQEIAYRALGERRGCVVAMNPKNGEILALVSKPSFDPNKVEKYLKAKGNPLLNRVIQGQYPPGSIFKIITEIAALEEGVISENDRIECTGEMEVGDRVFHCWKEEGHGWIDINLALPFSCNIFFGTIGMRLGSATLLEYAKKFGFGEPTGIDLPGEKPGYIPPPQISGGPLNLAIGQGAILATPIQLLSLISTVANGGNIWKPYVVKEIVSPEGKVIKSFSPVLRKTVYISPETLEILKRGLRNVVVFGTGVNAQVENLKVAGKTGTAQRASSELELPTHGAFACYAPADDPEISLVVFLDTGSSAVAARIAGNILREYFSDNKILGK